MYIDLVTESEQASHFVRLVFFSFQSRSNSEDPEQLRLKQKAKEVGVCARSTYLVLELSEFPRTHTPETLDLARFPPRLEANFNLSLIGAKSEA